MTRGITWEGVEYLVVTKVQIRIALPTHSVNQKSLEVNQKSLEVNQKSLEVNNKSL